MQIIPLQLFFKVQQIIITVTLAVLNFVSVISHSRTEIKFTLQWGSLSLD